MRNSWTIRAISTTWRKALQTDSHFKTLGKMLHVMENGAFTDRFTGTSKEDFVTWKEKEREVLSSLTGVKKLLEIEKAGASKKFKFKS